MSSFSYRDGRIWVQEKKFESYTLLLPYGLTDFNDPTGSLNPVRQPSRSQRGASDVSDVLRGEPDLPGFTIETRLFKTLNYMMKWRLRPINFQVHLGACGRPDNYKASQVAIDWDTVRRGDLSGDRAAQIQGDDAPIALTTPWMAENGPRLLDFEAEFISRMAIPEGQAITDIAMILDGCEDITDQYDPGDVGYLVTEAGSGVYDTADVWYTTDAWETPVQLANQPFASGEDISALLVFGIPNDHRVLVARGTTDAGNPAEIAYADVTTLGTVTWTNANVGSVNGEYITHLGASDYGHIYAVTDAGRIYISKDGGVSWTLKKATGAQLNEVAAHPEGIVWTGGASEGLWLSEDYGEAWSQITAPSDFSGAVTTVAVTPDGTFFFGGDDGSIYGSYDDGKNFTALSLQGFTVTNVQRIRAVDDINIWAIGDDANPVGRAFRSTDGGANFLLWNLNMPTNSGLNALFMADPNYAFVGGEPQDGQGFLTKTKSNVYG